MATTIGFAKVQDYLSGFASLGVIGNSPHRAFWKFKKVNGVQTPVTYNDFINGNVPNVDYHGSPIPIIWKDFPLLSPIFLILAERNGYAGISQMIPGGPHLTDNGLQVPLSDGTQVAGSQILADLEAWLGHGFPENPQQMMV